MQLWFRIEEYAKRNRLNRSQVVERGMQVFLSKEIYDIAAELIQAEMKVAMLKAQIKSTKEIEELLKNETSN